MHIAPGTIVLVLLFGRAAALGQAPPPPPPPPVVHYLEIPIEGAVGFPGGDVTALGLRDALRWARGREWITHIVFTIDSTGGDTAEAARMGAVLDAFDDRFLYMAVVRRSIGPSLAVLLHCEQVFVCEPDDPRVALSAVSERGEEPGGRRRRRDLEHDWVVELRRRGHRGGHDPLVVEALVQHDRALFASVGAEGEPLVAAARPTGKGSRRWRQVDGKKTVLALTARDAIDVGLARPLPAGVDGVGPALGVPGLWTSAGRYGAARMQRAAERLRRAEAKRVRTLTRAHTHLDRIVALVEEVERASEAAARADPNTTRYPTQGGGVRMMTPRSQARWRKRSDEAIEAWFVVLQIVQAAGRQFERARACRAWLRRHPPYVSLAAQHVSELRGLDMMFHKVASREVPLLRAADEAWRRIRRLRANRDRVR
jgi:hypothetical protein